MQRITFFIIPLLCFCLGCKSTKNISKVESTPTKFVMPELNSTLNLHYKISKQATKDTFNTIIDQYLASDMALTALGMDIVINKFRDAEIEISQKKVLTRMPIEIGLSKKTFINNINARGVLDLNFMTNLEIDSSWNLITKTTLEHYEWLEEPKLDFGGFEIPIGKLANNIIDKSKDQLVSQIDQAVNEQLSIRDKVLDMMKYVEKPIEVDTIMNSWLHLVPENVYMSEIQNEQNWSRGNITVHSQTNITESEPKDILTGLKLPVFNWEEELDDTSHINIVMNLSYEKIDQYLNENYKGKTFKNEGKEITINSIHLYNKGDKLVTQANVSGSVNGDLHISGKPIFDNDKQVFYTDDIDIDIKTKNMLHKAGAWLFKGKIKNQLKDLMRFSVKENLEAVQEKINSEVDRYKVPQQLDLKADIRKLNINRFVLGGEKIHAFITLNVYLEATILDMRVFNHQQNISKLRK